MTIKPDEIRLTAKALQADAAGQPCWPIDLAPDMHPRRRSAICSKWSRRGWYDYGTVIDRGWLTDAGRVALGSRINQENMP